MIYTATAGVVKVKVCSHLRWGRIFRKPRLYAYPAGAYFCAHKSRQNTLGALPQDPCRWLCWIRIDLRREPKSIRTAHRIAPKVAAAHLPFPPTPFPDGGKGARMGGRLETDRNALGVLGLVGSRAADLEVFASLPHSPPPLRRGQGWWFAVLRSSAAAIKMRRRLFLSPSACSTDLFLGVSLKINSYPAQQGDRVFRAQP